MPYTRTTTINSAPGGDTVKQAVLDLDTDLTGAFTHLNTVQSDVDANQVVTDGHIAATAAHGATGAVVGTTNVQTLTNKTIDLTSNALTGTLAQFNTAVSDADLLSTASAAATYAPVANGVTNGDSHDHSGGDGAQIAYSSLSGIPATFAPSSHTIGSHSDWPATVDMTEVGYLNGVTSAIQTQLNAKQDTLVSGTNIKTVNSTSLVGMGDVVVQPTLVSGTNIKTINTLSLLGAGDLSIPALTDGDKGDITVSGGGATWTLDSSVVSAFARTLLDDADAAAARTTLEVASYSAATETTAGVVELATAAEVQAGTDTVRAVTPAGLASFDKSLATNGYYKLPGGLIIQWGIVGSITVGGITVTLPIAFPNACRVVLPAIIAGTTDDYEIMVSSVSNTSFVIKSHGAAAPGGYWFALGH